MCKYTEYIIYIFNTLNSYAWSDIAFNTVALNTLQL